LKAEVESSSKAARARAARVPDLRITVPVPTWCPNAHRAESSSIRPRPVPAAILTRVGAVVFPWGSGRRGDLHTGRGANLEQLPQDLLGLVFRTYLVVGPPGFADRDHVLCVNFIGGRGMRRTQTRTRMHVVVRVSWLDGRSCCERWRWSGGTRPRGRHPGPGRGRKSVLEISDLHVGTFRNRGKTGHGVTRWGGGE